MPRARLPRVELNSGRMAQVLGVQDDSDDWRTLAPTTYQMAEAFVAMGFSPQAGVGSTNMHTLMVGPFFCMGEGCSDQLTK